MMCLILYDTVTSSYIVIFMIYAVSCYNGPHYNHNTLQYYHPIQPCSVYVDVLLVIRSPHVDSISVLCSIIAENKLAGIDSIEGASKVIEHCHRIGPFQQGKTRAIIANIYSRPLRNQLLKDARDVNNNSNNDIYIAPDMTKADHMLKLKAREQMKRAHGQGKKVVFRKGKLIIDSEVVSIE